MSSPSDSERKVERRSGRHLDGKALVGAIDAAIRALPTAADKEGLRSSLNELISFLSEVRDALDLVPAIEDAKKAEQALATLREHVGKAERNPFLAAALGLHGASTGPARTKRVGRPGPAGGVQGLLARLRKLPVDGIRAELEDPERHPVALLAALAAELGVHGGEKLGRVALSHQVTMKIANYRGYEQLRGSADTEDPDRRS